MDDLSAQKGCQELRECCFRLFQKTDSQKDWGWKVERKSVFNSLHKLIEDAMKIEWVKLICCFQVLVKPI